MKKLLLVAALSTLTACESEDLFSSDSDESANTVSVLNFEPQQNAIAASYTFDASYQVNEKDVSDSVNWHWTVAKTTGEHKLLHPEEDPTYTFSEPGEYKISAKVSEVSGEVIAEKSIFMDIPTADIDPATVLPSPVITVTNKNGRAITFDSSASSYSGGEITETEWIIDGQKIALTDTQYTFQADGTYPISLKVVSGDDRENSITELITVQEEPSIPDADFSYTADKLEVTLDATVSTNITSHFAAYAWDFGNGTASDVAKPTVTYAAEGDYTVTLTVTTNENQTNSVEKVISVKEEGRYVTCDVLTTSSVVYKKTDEEQCFSTLPISNLASAEAWCRAEVQKYIDSLGWTRFKNTRLTWQVRQQGNNEC